MTTLNTPGCTECPLKGDVPFVPDQLVRLASVVVLADRVSDPPVPDRLLAAARLQRGVNVSFGHALRCEAGRRVRSGVRFEKALKACRAHDDWSGVKVVVCTGPVGWQALGLSEWALSRGYVREVAA